MPTRELHRPARSPVHAADVSLVVLALLAPVLGGTTELWAQATIVLGCGLLILWSPPGAGPKFSARTASPISSLPAGQRMRAGRVRRVLRPITTSALGVLLPLAGLFVLCALEFLPATWFGSSAWRQTLVGDLELTLPGTLSPQPWLSLENALMLLATLTWAAFLATRSWRTKRSALLSLYAGGVAMLGLVGLGFWLASYRPPFWPAGAGGLGFFPNRNQAGNVLALGGLIALALAFHRFRRKRGSGFLWAAAYAVLGVAVVVNYSRAGMGIFFLGSLAWLCWVAWKTRRREQSALGLAGVLTALTLFLIFGGKSLERFLPQPEAASESSLGGRLRMQAEALPLLRQASWHGIGLGNFQHAFPRYQHASALLNERAIHPESDWVWAGVELGWLGPVLILAAVAAWLGRHWPRASEPGFLLRSAIVVSALAFLLHGIVDVSGHRIGSVWPAILLLSLLKSEDTERRTDASGRRTEDGGQQSVGRGLAALAWRRGFVGGVSGGLAVLLLGVAAFWLASVFQLHPWPTSARLQRVKAMVERAQEKRYADLVVQLTSETLRWAPLDRDLYFHRGLAWLRSGTNIEAALTDFHRADGLEPNSSELPLTEGLAWLERDPRLALAAWSEALARAGRIERPGRVSGASPAAGLYRRMLAAAQRFSGLRNDLRALAGDDRELLLVFLEQATPEEFNGELQKLLLDDPALHTLTAAQRTAWFARWAKLGDRALLEAQLQRNPDWLETGWRSLATVLAGRDAFEEACGLAQRFAAAPVLPAAPRSRNVAELARNLLLTTNDFVSGYALYRLDLTHGDAEDALRTLEKLTAQRECPRYFHFLEARLCAQQRAWPQAWQAWKRYLSLE